MTRHEALTAPPATLGYLITSAREPVATDDLSDAGRLATEANPSRWYNGRPAGVTVWAVHSDRAPEDVTDDAIIAWQTLEDEAEAAQAAWREHIAAESHSSNFI